MAVLTISIDLTKNEFQIHGLGRNRKSKLRKRIKVSVNGAPY